jgi:hypothetical protein
MEFRKLRYFVVAAEEENLHRAAGRLFITQPALSRQIQELESELGSSFLNGCGSAFGCPWWEYSFSSTRSRSCTRSMRHSNI